MSNIRKSLLFFLGCIAATVSFAGYRSNTAAPRDSIVYILIYGLPSSRQREAIFDKVALKYGFRYLPVAGCVVDEETDCCVQLLNNITYEYLAMRNGADWRARHSRDLDSIFGLQDSAIAIVSRSSFIAKYIAQRKDLNEIFLPYQVKILDKNTCEVEVHDGIPEGEHQIIEKFLVDIKKKKARRLHIKPVTCNESHLRG